MMDKVKHQVDSVKQNKDLQGHVTLWLALSTLAVSVGCASQMGYSGGGISVPAPFIREFLNQTNQKRWNGSASELVMTWIYAVTITMFSFGAALGSMLSGSFSDRFGRKKCLLYSNFISLTAALCMGVCQTADTYGLLVLGRFLIGVFGGFSFTIMPFYLAEIAPVNLRGSVGVFSSLCRASGTLVAHILGFACFYSQETWPILLALTGSMAVFNLILFPFCPESPRWLYISENRREEAIHALQRLRGPNADLSAEIEEMKNEYEKNIKGNSTKKVTTIDILRFRRPEWKMALLLGGAVMCGVQLSGYSTVMMYTTDIYASAGMGMREIAYATVGLSTLNTVMTGISVLIVDRFGRRPLLLIPFSLGIVSLLGITVFINQQENYDFMKWLTVAVIYLFVSSFSLGPVSIKNLVAAEMWLQDARPAAMTLTMQFNWWSTVFVNITFPVLEGAIGSYTYLFYTAFLLVATIYLFIYLPETKQRTFDEIVKSLSKHKKTTMTMEGSHERSPSQIEVYEMEVTDEVDEETTKEPIDLRTNYDVLTSPPNMI